MTQSNSIPFVLEFPDPEREKELQDIELKLLLEAIFQAHGFDFRDYALSSLRRRILSFMHEEGYPSAASLQHKVIHDPTVMKKLLMALSVNVTSMFRDPEFYLAFREQILPFLRTYPFVRIWSAGCCTGEEVYSLAILLHEEGLLDRCRVYATDLNNEVIASARQGVFPLNDMKQNSKNYFESGGKNAFSNYYVACYDFAKFDASLMRNVVFAQHNLATDSSFNEFNVIFCRNVLIYFNRDLQNRVHSTLRESLCNFGFLCLGSREMINFTPYENDYRQLNEQKIYQRYR
ncbi:MAG TPA: protein-glutamate O-methyltransferase CheR [Acidobacteriota bacterium]